MVSLKPTSLITTVIVITLIVLTIIDSVFSESEVKKCASYISQVYHFRVVRLNDPSIAEINLTIKKLHLGDRKSITYGSTPDDMFIGFDTLKMFKKGFLVFNLTEIHILNSKLVDRRDGIFDPIYLKQMITVIIGDYIATQDDEYESYHALEYFSKQLDVLSKPEDLNDLLIDVQNYLRNAQGLTPAQAEYIISKRDEYAIGYFNKLLEKASIIGKESLRNPEEFCNELLPQKEINIADCTKIIKKKFKLNDGISGSEIFDILYEEWAEYQIINLYKLSEEEIEFNQTLARTPQHEKQEARKYYRKLKKLYIYSLQSFYNQFENILDQADVSNMPSPIRFCDEYINGASTSQDVYDDYTNTDATSIDDDFENLNI